MKNKRKKYLLYYVGISLLINLIFFGSLYFFNQPFEIWVLLITHFAAAFIYWFILPIKAIKKIFFICITFIISSIIGFLIMFSTMYIPGSREHNYVMYSICLPKIDQYYKERGLNRLSLEYQGKDGNPKWWYQHLECEDNFYKGNGPVFSDNPPGFITK